MAKSSIEWTGETWNPTVGCTKISAGCRSCYAEVMHRRLTAMGQEKYTDGFTTVKPYRPHLQLPLERKKPTLYFVNSMSDLFHEDIPLDYLVDVFRVMKHANWHTFQVLTKRAELLESNGDLLVWPDNVWMGVSVEDYRQIDRIDHLRRTRAKVKFLSLEPLIGPLPGLDLTGIDWVIVGGESGAMARELKPEWVESIQYQCQKQGVAFFFKQTGTVWAKREGYAAKKGGDINEWPEHLQVRLMPIQYHMAQNVPA